MAIEFEKRYVGGLDMTNNVKDVVPIDAIDAKNLTNNDRQGNIAVDLKGLRGIEQSFGTLSPISARTKSIRFYIDPDNDPFILPVGNICTIQFTTIRGVAFGGSLLVANPPVNSAANLRTEVLTFITSAPFTGIGITGACSVLSAYAHPNGGTGYYFDISFNIAEDWNISVVMSPGIPQYFTQVWDECWYKSQN